MWAKSALFTAILPGKEYGSCAGFGNEVEERVVGMEDYMVPWTGRCGEHSCTGDDCRLGSFLIDLDDGILLDKTKT